MIIFGGCTSVFTPQQSNYESCPTARSLLSQDHNRYLQYEDQYVNDMFVFDTASLKWTKINYRNKASGRKSIDDVVVKVPSPRAGHTFTLVNSYFYLFGGYGGGVHHDDLWMFSPVTLSWVQIVPKSSASAKDSTSNNQSVSSSSASPSMSSGSMTAPLGRTGHSAFSVGNYLIIYGGYSAGTVFKDVWAFDTVKLTWKFVSVESFLAPQYLDSFVFF
jgi:N-acetylneuraminic acid mutarotase